MAKTPPTALPVDATIAGNVAASPMTPPTLQIALLGGFRVIIAGRAIAPGAWRLDKARSLVKLLALAPGQHLSRDQIMDRLWPTLGPAAAANNFYQALHAARQALATGGALPSRTTPLLRLQRQVLWLHADGTLVIDIVAFEKGATFAHRTRNLVDYEAALERYGGELLPEDRYEDWATSRREALRESFIALLIETALHYEEHGASAKACATLARVVAEDPAHEAAHAGLMRLFARGGQRQQALQQYARLQAALRQLLDAEPDPRTQQLHRQILTRQFPQATLPPAPAPMVAPDRHNLPLSLTSFIGRTDDLATANHLLNTTRLLTLTGAGGCGKTRLALALATTLVPVYADGVWLVALAALADPALLPATVAAALGIHEEPGQPFITTLVAALRTRTLLVILDNCEHLIDACAALVAPLPASCPHLRILATSRETLRTAGELAWRVPALRVPARTSGTPSVLLTARAVEDLARYEAVTLFVERARWHQPTFALNAATAGAVGAICRRLDGLPLPLELAAAQLPSMTVAQIAKRLDDASRLLSRGDRTAPSHQQTLKLTLEWSYALLSTGERHLLRHLAVFAGGFDLTAVEAIMPSAVEALRTLTVLVDKSLVEVQEEGTAIRYRLLETVRQDAYARLVATGEVEQIQERHAIHYLALAEVAAAALEGPTEERWLARLAQEHDNLRAALQHLAANALTEPGLRLGSALWRFWAARGHQTEGRAWLGTFLAFEDGTRRAGGQHVRMEALFGAARLAYNQGDYPTAQAFFTAVSAQAAALGNEEYIAGALTHLGHIARDQGDYPTAHARYEEGLRLRRALGDPLMLSISLSSLSRIAVIQGDHATGRRLAEEGLAIQRRVGATEQVTRSLFALGEVTLAQADDAMATVFYAEGLARAREVDDHEAVARALAELGHLASAQGELDRAAALLAESLTMCRDQGIHLLIAHCLTGLAGIAAAQGRSPSALRRAGAAAALRSMLGIVPAPVWQIRYERALAPAWRALGEVAGKSAWATDQETPLSEVIADVLHDPSATKR